MFSTVCQLLRKYEEKNLMDRCWKVIDKQTEAAVTCFKQLISQATKQCEKQSLAVNGAKKRRILGEDIVYAIRFPVMKQEEFAAVVLDAKLLDPVSQFNTDFFSWISRDQTVWCYPSG